MSRSISNLLARLAPTLCATLVVLAATPLLAQAPSATPPPPVPSPPAGSAPGVAVTPGTAPDFASELQPPDGKWLVDELGREYFVRKFAKPAEGAFLRKEGNRVRLPGGFTIDIVGEDAEWFMGKVYRTDHITTRFSQKPAPPSEEELAAVAAQYRFDTPETDRVRFAPMAPGLPTSGQWRNGFDIADVNLDGRLDIVHGGIRRELGGKPHIFLGDGKGDFKLWEKASYPNLPYDYGDIAVGDFNKDGKPDLGLAIHLRGLIVLLGDGKGGFVHDAKGLGFEAGPLRPGQAHRFSSRALTAVDWDGDGADELLVLAEGPVGSFGAKGGPSRIQQSYGVAIHKRGADGTWVQLEGGKTHPQLFGDSVVTADFDGDGRPDFAAGSNARGNAAIAHLQSPEGGWAYLWVEGVRPRSFARAVGAGDFDGDGRADLLVGYQSVELGVWRTGVDLLLARPEGTFERRTVYNEPGAKGIFSLASGDIDGDGHLDFVAGAGDGRIFAFLGDGKGGFAREDTADLEAEPTCRVYDLGLADFDRDGRADLVAAFAGEECPEGGRLAAWRSLPAGR